MAMRLHRGIKMENIAAIESKFEAWYLKHKGNDYHTSSMILQYKRIFMEGYYQGVSAEREECALLAEDYITNEDGNKDKWTITSTLHGFRIATAIRQRPK